MKKKLLGLTALAVLLVIVMGGCDLFGPGFEETAITGTGTSGTWTFDHGICTESSTTSGTYSVTLYNADESEEILFSATSSNEPEALQFNLLDLESAVTVTYYDGSTNYILIDGYRQLTVDTTANTAVVKLNIYDNTNNLSFNGTVTLDVTQ